VLGGNDADFPIPLYRYYAHLFERLDIAIQMQLFKKILLRKVHGSQTARVRFAVLDNNRRAPFTSLPKESE